MGGVSIDSIGRVMKPDGNIFEGLYAAGEVTGGVHGINRLGECINRMYCFWESCW